MPTNSHISLSSAWYPQTPWVPFEQVAAPLSGGPIVYACRQLLTHLIWGGVLERHPKLKAVFTEQGSAWVVGELQAMDYSFEGSFLRRDVREVIKLKPSEYFARQCSLGSSTFSRAEVQMRDLIGVDKMALGNDFPHHEGTWGAGPGTFEYLRATLGVAGVDENDARRMLGENAAELWGFDTGALKPLVQRIGHPMNSILQGPDEDYFPRGDVHKPAGSMAARDCSWQDPRYVEVQEERPRTHRMKQGQKKLYIGGEWVRSMVSESIPVVDCFTEEPIGDHSDRNR